MSQITNQKDITTPHLGIVEDRLKDKKVLVVLDGVDRLVQLEAMANETRWFGPWSRIIITTQDQKLLWAHEINHIYKEWTRALPRLKIRLDGEIESILKLSYDALCDEDKKLFIYIACFFNEEPIDIVEGNLENSFLDVRQGLHVLAEKSLISMHTGLIYMPDLLAQLGREIARKQYVSEPGKRQFLVDARDIDEVLNDDNADRSNVIGIDLSFSEIILISERAFERLSNLKFLRLEGDGTSLDFPRKLSSISRKLRMLEWVWCKMPCLPSNFHTKFLVTLDLSLSECEKVWEGIQPLNNLKRMALFMLGNLKELPDLSTATNLSLLFLFYCSSLVELPSSIGNAINLQNLILKRCSSLVSLPQLPYSLLELDVGNCESLERLDCKFRNPDICLYFYKCFKLNQEARDLIIRTPTNKYAVLPAGELPECFTYRALGCFVAVKLNQKLLRTSTKFKVCILLDFENGNSYRNEEDSNEDDTSEDDSNEGDTNEDDRNVYCSITSKQNALTACTSSREIKHYFAKHLYIFEVEVEEVTSTDLDFEFKLGNWNSGDENWEIKECGVFQLGDGDEDYETSDRDEEEQAKSPELLVREDDDKRQLALPPLPKKSSRLHR